MATMLNGAAIMDGALLIIAANETCPQPQTAEHLMAAEIMRLKDIIILQNKVDLIQENVAINQHEVIQKFIQVLCTCYFKSFRYYSLLLSVCELTNTAVLPGNRC